MPVVSFCNANGVMTGLGDSGNFGPKQFTTRCQMAKIVSIADTTEGWKQWSDTEVMVKAAWDETVTEKVYYAKCNYCGADITNNTSAHQRQHALKNEPSSFGEAVKYVNIVIHHDAEYGAGWVTPA